VCVFACLADPLNNASPYSTFSKIDLPFETEKQLQERGTSRTPDILLTCPLAIKLPNNNNDNNSNDNDGSFDNADNSNNCKVICWIDSKALFGDENTHQTSVLPQAQSYVHRFGPGLVLYWFGHAPLNRLGDCQGDIVICGWQLPTAFMLPTGEKIVRKQQTAQQSKQIDAARTS
jgi:CDAN1-interacting nuclease 1